MIERVDDDDWERKQKKKRAAYLAYLLTPFWEARSANTHVACVAEKRFRKPLGQNSRDVRYQYIPVLLSPVTSSHQSLLSYRGTHGLVSGLFMAAETKNNIIVSRDRRLFVFVRSFYRSLTLDRWTAQRQMLSLSERDHAVRHLRNTYSIIQNSIIFI
jgi:hypothetical protein